MNLSPALRFLASQTWAVEGRVFDDLVALLDRHANGERLSAEAIAAVMTRDPKASDAREPAMQIMGDTAVIPVRGLLARYSDGVNGMCQERGRSAQSVQGDLLNAAGQGVNRIVLVIDSPGGEVSGTAETARLVAQLGDSGIETVAYLDGSACSAAYWIASACNKVIASAPTVRVGSIGCAMTFTERSDDKGEKTHVIKSAAAKGAGPVNDAMRANLQALCNDMAAAFASAVQQGRAMTDEQIAAVATGEVWTAQTALTLGLIDGIQDLSAIIGRQPLSAGALASGIASPTAAAKTASTKEATMSNVTLAQVLALKASHPNHKDLILDRAAAGDTEAQIQAAIKGADQTKAAVDQALATAKTQHDSALTALASKHADELKAIQDKLTAEQGKVTAAESRATTAEAKLTKAQGHAGGADPGHVDAPPKGKTITQEEFAALGGAGGAKFLAEGGKVEGASTNPQAKA